ncbi:beta-ketoacyl synthase chain length factor [Alkalisalibacterium limincola]|uniref:beta-ketoacyl synthase chain length factor n=1 Tax=Alkalisalibacterium limincola TaxID=2699169 RepID=UPI003CCD0976
MGAAVHEFTLKGLGWWSSGLPDWASASAFVRTGEVPEDARRKPAPELLAPNERRRAPDTVALALQVALDACATAGEDPAQLSSVFTSTHGDLAITDYMCQTLVDDPGAISPTKFHNSVHNAAAGYWTIGAGCMAPATAISGYQASFAEGLLETIGQLVDGTDPVLLVAYDAQSTGPLAEISRSEDLLGAALVLSRTDGGEAPRLRITRERGDVPVADGPLSARHAGNAMAPMLPLFEQLARGVSGTVLLEAGPGWRLRVEVVA